MTFAQVLAATVTVQHGWIRIVAQGLDECDVCQTATVASTELPAQYLTSSEVHDERQVKHTGADTQVGEVLCPGIGFLGHGAVVHAILWPGVILKQGVGMQMVCWRTNLRLATIALVFLPGTHGVYLG